MFPHTAKDSRLDQTIKKLRKGDEKALETIFRTFKDKLHGFCLKAVKSPDVADDLVIEVFTKLWQKRDQIKTDTCFEAFLLTITKNHLLNFLKKQAAERHKMAQAMAEQRQALQTDEAPEMDLLDSVVRFVEQMPLQRQKVFKLQLEQGLSYEEIATTLGLSKNTVKTHLTEARKQLKSRFSTKESTATYTYS